MSGELDHSSQMQKGGDIKLIHPSLSLWSTKEAGIQGRQVGSSFKCGF